MYVLCAFVILNKDYLLTYLQVTIYAEKKLAIEQNVNVKLIAQKYNS